MLPLCRHYVSRKPAVRMRTATYVVGRKPRGDGRLIPTSAIVIMYLRKARGVKYGVRMLL